MKSNVVSITGRRFQGHSSAEQSAIAVHNSELCEIAGVEHRLNRAQDKETLGKFFAWMRVFSGVSPDASLDEQVGIFQQSFEREVSVFVETRRALVESQALNDELVGMNRALQRRLCADSRILEVLSQT